MLHIDNPSYRKWLGKPITLDLCAAKLHSALYWNPEKTQIHRRFSNGPNPQFRDGFLGCQIICMKQGSNKSIISNTINLASILHCVAGV